MANNTNNSFRVFFFIGAFGIIGIPILLNTLLQIDISRVLIDKVNIIGDETNWLSFWGSYIGVLIGSFITLYVLLKTLKQNESNNTNSQKLQIDVFKAQQKQQWLDNLIRELKENLDYVNISEVRKFVNILSFSPEKIENLISDELSQNITKPNAFSLNFVENDMDEIEKGYIEVFRKYSGGYGFFLTFLLDSVLLLNNDKNLDENKLLLKSLSIEKKIINPYVFSSKLSEAKSLLDFKRIVTDSVKNNFLSFTYFVQKHQIELIRQTQILVEHERLKVFDSIEK